MNSLYMSAPWRSTLSITAVATLTLREFHATTVPGVLP